MDDRGKPIPPDEVEALCVETGLDVEQLMVLLLHPAASFAHVPISSFPVGAVAQGRVSEGRSCGTLYLGANVEFPGQSLGFSVHAEQAAIINAWQHGEQEVTSIATSAAPCGHCRQFLYELVGAPDLQVLEPADDPGGRPRASTLSELLPHAFTGTDLGREGGLLDPRFEAATLSVFGAAEQDDALLELAVDAARRSYVPYTDGRAGCAIQTVDGRMFPGRYAESAAYNPSISPLESAVAFLCMNTPLGPLREIVRAVLVETPSSTGQKGATEAVLATIAPGVALEVHRAIPGR